MEITSTQNPRIKNLVRLQDHKVRMEERKFLIENEREIAIAIESGVKIQELYICPEYFKGEPDFIESIESEERYEVSREVFDKISYREHPEGILAVAEYASRKLADISPAEDMLVVVLAGVEKPGNIGAVLRTCDAAGVDLLILADAKTDIYNPNVIRSSIGTVFSVPTVEATSTEAIAWLQQKAIHIYSTTGGAAQEYTDCDYRPASALVIGAEDQGLDDTWLRAGQNIKIPMLGKADSLNASVSAAIVVYEAVRQRKF